MRQCLTCIMNDSHSSEHGVDVKTQSPLLRHALQNAPVHTVSLNTTPHNDTAAQHKHATCARMLLAFSIGET